jgi:hypothetical protein
LCDETTIRSSMRGRLDKRWLACRDPNHASKQAMQTLTADNAVRLRCGRIMAMNLCGTAGDK